jgi:hypothetical protein
MLNGGKLKMRRILLDLKESAVQLLICLSKDEEHIHAFAEKTPQSQ